LEIENHSSCRYDGITISTFTNGVENIEDRQVHCGTKTPFSHTYTNKVVKIGFYSDSSDSSGGFAFTWSAVHDPSVSAVAPVVVEVDVPAQEYHPVKQVFVMTDGDITNQGTVFQFVRDQAASMRVFSVGIGAASSTALVQGLAEAGNGFASFVSEQESDFYTSQGLAEIVVTGLVGASSGFITNVQLGSHAYPSYVDHVITSGTFIHILSDAAAENVALSYDISGHDANATHTQYSYTFDSSEAKASSVHAGAVKAIMGKKELQKLQADYEAQSENSTLGAIIVQKSIDANVLCPLTAFVGVMLNADGTEEAGVDDGHAIDASVSAENHGNTDEDVDYDTAANVAAAPETNDVVLNSVSGDAVANAKQNNLLGFARGSIFDYTTLTNAQDVDGSWAMDGVRAFITPAQEEELNALMCSESDKATIVAIIILRERFPADAAALHSSIAKGLVAIEMAQFQQPATVSAIINILNSRLTVAEFSQ